MNMPEADRRSTSRLTVVVATPDSVVSAARGPGGWLADAAPARARGEVTVAVVSDARMRSLNRSFRGKDAPSDVLSFPARGAGAAPNVGTPFHKAKPSRALRPGAPAGRRTAAQPETASLPPGTFLGDIVIAAGVASEQAQRAGHALRTELRILALHGLLHLLGHDHATDTGQMRRLETRLRRRAGLPEALIERHSPFATRRSLSRHGRTAKRETRKR